MRIADIVRQIRAVLPNYTDRFTTTLEISNILASSGLITINTAAPHKLVTDQAVTIAGVETRTPINSVSQDGLLHTFTTSSDHDLTTGFQSSVELSGFTDSDWNASFTLVSSVNRRSFTVRSTNSLPILNGNEFLAEPLRVDGINGVYPVTVVNPTTFTVTNNAALDGVYTPLTGTINKEVRVASVVNIDMALNKYTQQKRKDFWMFVEPVDINISKSKNSLSAAVSAIANGEDIRTRVIDGFTLYIVVNVTDQIVAESAQDICRHELLQPVTQTLYGIKPDSGLSTPTAFKAILKSAGVKAFDGTIYVYRYEFQVVYDLTEGDQVKPFNTRAYRDIDYTLDVSKNTSNSNPGTPFMHIDFPTDAQPI